MKKKYFGLIAVVILCSSLVLSAAYGYWLIQGKSDLEQRSGRLGPLEQLKFPPEKDSIIMQGLGPKLQSLNFPRNPDRSPVSLELFGYRPMTRQTVLVRPAEEKKTAVVFNYNITFALIAGGTGFCLIDGRLYHHGEVLPDGGIIEEIRADKVLINKHAQQSWVAVSRNETLQGRRNLE